VKNINGMKKWLLAGAVALAIAAPAGAASAASGKTTVQYKVYYVSQSTNTDWNAWVQQWLQKYYYGGNQPAQTQKPVQQPVQQQPAQQPATQQPAAPAAGTQTSTSSYAQQVVDLVNQERAKAGLPALKSNAALANVAWAKAKDMKDNNYFSHTSPTYGSPFDMMKKFGISYSYAGENIAMGQRTPAEVMKDWMNSPGHKANILSKNFTTIGVGYYNGAWVQMFIG
jgi:uncharacterized YkwD family protein